MTLDYRLFEQLEQEQANQTYDYSGLLQQIQETIVPQASVSEASASASPTGIETPPAAQVSVDPYANLGAESGAWIQNAVAPAAAGFQPLGGLEPLSWDFLGSSFGQGTLAAAGQDPRQNLYHNAGFGDYFNDITKQVVYPGLDSEEDASTQRAGVQQFLQGGIWPEIPKPTQPAWLQVQQAREVLAKMGLPAELLDLPQSFTSEQESGGFYAPNSGRAEIGRPPLVGKGGGGFWDMAPGTTAIHESLHALENQLTKDEWAQLRALQAKYPFPAGPAGEHHPDLSTPWLDNLLMNWAMPGVNRYEVPLEVMEWFRTAIPKVAARGRPYPTAGQPSPDMGDPLNSSLAGFNWTPAAGPMAASLPEQRGANYSLTGDAAANLTAQYGEDTNLTGGVQTPFDTAGAWKEWGAQQGYATDPDPGSPQAQAALQKVNAAVAAGGLPAEAANEAYRQLSGIPEEQQRGLLGDLIAAAGNSFYGRQARQVLGADVIPEPLIQAGIAANPVARALGLDEYLSGRATDGRVSLADIYQTADRPSDIAKQQTINVLGDNAGGRIAGEVLNQLLAPENVLAMGWTGKGLLAELVGQGSLTNAQYLRLVAGGTAAAAAAAEAGLPWWVQLAAAFPGGIAAMNADQIASAATMGAKGYVKRAADVGVGALPEGALTRQVAELPTPNMRAPRDVATGEIDPRAVAGGAPDEIPSPPPVPVAGTPPPAAAPAQGIEPPASAASGAGGAGTPPPGVASAVAETDPFTAHTIPRPSTLRSTSDLTQDALSQSSAFNKAAQIASNIAPVRSVINTVNPSALINKPPKALVDALGEDGAIKLQGSLLGYERRLDRANALVSAIEDDVAQQVRSIGFTVKDGRVTSVQGSPLVGDLFENPSRYSLTAKQRSFVNEVASVLQDMSRVERLAGVKKNEIFSGEGLYFPRRVLSSGEAENLKPAVKRLVGAKQSFQKGRYYETMEEGVKAGVKYEENIAALVAARLRAGLKATADKEIATIIKPLGRTVKAAEPAQIGEMGTMIPALGGSVFDTPVSNRLIEVLGTRYPGDIERAMSKINSVLLPMQAQGDLSFTFLQLLPTAFRNPAAFGKAMGAALDALVMDGRMYGKYVIDNTAQLERFMDKGLMWRGSDLSLSRAAHGKVMSQIFGKGPLGRLGRAFDNSMNVAALENAKAMAGVSQSLGPSKVRKAMNVALGNVKGETSDEIAASIANKMTGRIAAQSLGVSAAQRSIEGNLAFAPNYYRAALGLVADAMQGGMRGAEARAIFGSLIAGATVTHLAIAEATGQEPNLNPFRSDFLTTRIGGQNVGVGGAFYGLFRTVAEAIENPDDLNDILSMKNPVTRWVRGRLSPLLSLSVDLATQSDFLGNDISSIEEIAQHIGTRMLPFSAQTAIQEGIGPAVVTGLGGRAFPVSSYQELDLEARELAGKDYVSLDSREQAMVNAAMEAKGKPLSYADRDNPWWRARDDAYADLKRNMPPEIADAPMTKKALTIEDYGDIREVLVKWEQDTYKLTKVEAELAVEHFLRVTNLEELVRQYREDVLRADPGFVKAWLDAYNAGEAKYKPPKWAIEFVENLEGVTP